MNRRMKMAALAAGAAALVLGACGDDGGDGLSRDELVEELVADSVDTGLPEDAARDQAECLIDQVGVDRVNELYEASEAGENFEEVASDEEMQEFSDAMMTCVEDIDPGALEGGLDPEDGAADGEGGAEDDGAEADAAE